MLRVEKRRNPFRILFRQPEGKRLFGRPWRRWQNNIKMVLKYDGSVKTGYT